MFLLLLPFTALAVTAYFGVNYGTYVGLGTQMDDTAYGNEDRVSLTKKIISTSAVGLLVIIIAYALSTWIFGIILNAT